MSLTSKQGAYEYSENQAVGFSHRTYLADHRLRWWSDRQRYGYDRPEAARPRDRGCDEIGPASGGPDHVSHTIGCGADIGGTGIGGYRHRQSRPHHRSRPVDVPAYARHVRVCPGQRDEGVGHGSDPTHRWAGRFYVGSSAGVVSSLRRGGKMVDRVTGYMAKEALSQKIKTVLG